MLSLVLFLPAVSPWEQGEFCLSSKGLVLGGRSVSQRAAGHSRRRLRQGLELLFGSASLFVVVVTVVIAAVGGGAFSLSCAPLA